MEDARLMRSTVALNSLIMSQNITVRPYVFESDVMAFYLRTPLFPTPEIAIRADLHARECRTYRSILAEELGHHFTGSGSSLHIVTYSDWLQMRRDEYRGLRWAADYMCPLDQVHALAAAGRSVDDMADHFDVTRELILVQWDRLSMARYATGGGS